MSKKPASIKDFHIDRGRSGDILHGWVKAFPKPRKEIIADTGLSEDTFNGCIYGRSNEVSLERVLKIALVTGHSLAEYLALVMPPSDEIDFADRIKFPNDPDTAATYAEIFAQNAERFAQEPPTAHSIDVPFEMYSHIVEEHRRQIDQLQAVYAIIIDALQKQIEDLRADRDAIRQQHINDMQQLTTLHAENMKRADDQIYRLRRRCACLGGNDYADVGPKQSNKEG